MTTFNIISFETGRIMKTIKAISYDKATEQAELLNICMDDYFIQSAEQTEKERSQLTRWYCL
jgi:hypothetical protein